MTFADNVSDFIQGLQDYFQSITDTHDHTSLSFGQIVTIAKNSGFVIVTEGKVGVHVGQSGAVNASVTYSTSNTVQLSVDLEVYTASINSDLQFEVTKELPGSVSFLGGEVLFGISSDQKLTVAVVGEIPGIGPTIELAFDAYTTEHYIDAVLTDALNNHLEARDIHLDDTTLSQYTNRAAEALQSSTQNDQDFNLEAYAAVVAYEITGSVDFTPNADFRGVIKHQVNVEEIRDGVFKVSFIERGLMDVIEESYLVNSDGVLIGKTASHHLLDQINKAPIWGSYKADADGDGVYEIGSGSPNVINNTSEVFTERVQALLQVHEDIADEYIASGMTQVSPDVPSVGFVNQVIAVGPGNVPEAFTYVVDDEGSTKTVEARWLNDDSLVVLEEVRTIDGDLLYVHQRSYGFETEGVANDQTTVASYNSGNNSVVVETAYFQHNEDGTVTYTEQRAVYDLDTDTAEITLTSSVNPSEVVTGLYSNLQSEIQVSIENFSGQNGPVKHTVESIRQIIDGAASDVTASINEDILDELARRMATSINFNQDYIDQVLLDNPSLSPIINLETGKITPIYNEVGELIGYSGISADDQREQTITFIFDGEQNVIGARTITDEGDLSIKETILNGDKTVDVNISGTNISLGQVGSIFGSSIGKHLGGDDPFARIGLDTALATAGDVLFETGGLFYIGNDRGLSNIRTVLEDIDTTLIGKASGAISGYLVGELLAEIGVEGIEGEIFNTAAGATINNLITNIQAVGDGTQSFASVTDGLTDGLTGRLDHLLAPE